MKKRTYFMKNDEPDEALVGKRSVIIIDDNTDICRELVKLLEVEGHSVLAVHSAEQAKRALFERPVDIVLLDQKLPDGNGLDLIRDIRKKNADAQIIVMTGFPDLDSIKEATQKEVFDYISKPFRAEKIVDMVNKAIKAN